MTRFKPHELFDEAFLNQTKGILRTMKVNYGWGIGIGRRLGRNLEIARVQTWETWVRMGEV